VREVGQEEEEGLEYIQEPSVMVAEVGRADSKQVSGKIILNPDILSYWEANDCLGHISIFRIKPKLEEKELD
jgi:hypothetical protein